jgi:hypothetical protein
MTAQDSLVNMIIDQYIKTQGVDYDEALDVVYTSGLVREIADPNKTYSTWAVDDLLVLLERLKNLPPAGA